MTIDGSKLICDDITARGYDPDVVRTVLIEIGNDATRTHWPSWGQLDALLNAEQHRVGTQKLLAAPGAKETSSQRWGRLGLTAKRQSAVGVGQWKVVSAREGQLTDDELVAAFERLERGQRAFPIAEERRPDLVLAGMRTLEGDHSPVAELLRQIGETKMDELREQGLIS